MSESEQDDPQSRLYRELIDAFVHSCRAGAGQVSARRIRAGVWDASPSTTGGAMNVLLQCQSPSERETLAELVADEFETGVFDVIAHLSWAQLEPLDRAYEGDAYHDFVGRLDGWTWPEDRTPTQDPPMSGREPDASEDERYRKLIDACVTRCEEKSLTTTRLRAGVWFENAKPRTDPTEHSMNVLLQTLSSLHRERSSSS